jgi:hypothetical protein
MPSMIGNLQGKLYLAVAIAWRGLIQELLHRLVLQLPSFMHMLIDYQVNLKSR